MSIEQLIADHTAALQENTAAVKLLTASLAGRTPAADKPADKPKADKPADKPKADKAPKEDPKAGKDDKPAGVEFATVRALVMKLAATNRKDIQAINAAHDIPKLGALLDDENDFSTVNDQAKLEAVYADLQALEL